MTQLTSAVDETAEDDVRCERIRADSPLSPWVSVDPHCMHGEPCFKGTRVLVQALFDHLRDGDSVSDFLAGFPDVCRDQAVAVIDLSASGFLDGLRGL